MTDEFVDGEYRWPDADVVWHGTFAGDAGWEIAHGVRVFVMRDVEALRRACEDPGAGAWSLAYNAPDAEGVGALIMFAPPVTLSAVVHEVTHVALYWARELTTSQQRASRWLAEHPESVAELIGNLSAVLWHSIPEDLLDR